MSWKCRRTICALALALRKIRIGLGKDILILRRRFGFDSTPELFCLDVVAERLVH